jgi:hypothetical protein
MSQWAYKTGARESNSISADALRALIERGAMSETSEIRELPDGKWLYLRDTPFAAIRVKTRPVVVPTPVSKSMRAKLTPKEIWTVSWVTFLGLCLIGSIISQCSFQSTEVDLDRAEQILEERQTKIAGAKNAAEKALIYDQYAKKLCAEVPGGKITGWSGILVDVVPSLIGSGVYAQIAVKGRLLETQTFDIGTPFFNKLATMTTSASKKAGSPVVIDGYFGRVLNWSCVDFDGSYWITVTDIR